LKMTNDTERHLIREPEENAQSESTPENQSQSKQSQSKQSHQSENMFESQSQQRSEHSPLNTPLSAKKIKKSEK